MTPDNELLRRYAQTRSEDAFAELVRRHVNLVYSAAVRQVNGDAHLARDVAQTVFTDLARKAGALARRESLTGWLYTGAYFVAAKMARTENRRRNREEKFMREPTNESGAGVSPAQNPDETDWGKIRPALDDAMHELKESDREAILLRYFENRHFAEVGAKLGLNENVARMRVERALEKLRAVFARRGIATAAALASAISANAVQVAPTGLATSLATTSVAAVGTGTTFTLLKFMTATHIKLGLSALVVAGAATAMVEQHQTQTRLRDEGELLRQQIVQLETDNQSLSNRLASIGEAKSLTDEQMNELLRLHGEVTQLRREIQESAPTESAMKSWAANVILLKQKLRQMPELNIPELKFVSEQDWADAAWDEDLSTEDGVREALSKLREQAENRFLNVMMKAAFEKYLAANNDILPDSLTDLKPYFDTPVTDDILQRYKLLQTGKPDKSAWLV